MNAVVKISLLGDFGAPRETGRSYAFWTMPTSGSNWRASDSEQVRDSAECALKVGRISEQFRTLATKWLAETAFVSSVDDMRAAPTFTDIVRLGTPALPLVLQEMVRESGYWFPVIQEITGADPVAPGDRGNVQKMSDAWINWGRGKGFA